MISKMTNSQAFIRLLYFKPYDVILLYFTLRQSVSFSLPICYNCFPRSANLSGFRFLFVTILALTYDSFCDVTKTPQSGLDWI